MAKRREPVRRGGRRDDGKVRRPARDGAVARRAAEAPTRGRRPVRDQRPPRSKGSGPGTSPMQRPTDAPGRPKNAAQAKARAKARKAKAPKIVRPPLRERILIKLSAIEFNPRHLVSRVPFVVLVIGALGLGLGVTLWLSTDAAERSYELGHARETNQALLQQKEALERDVLEAQAAPALAESARQLGMIPSRDTAHLVQDPNGAWVVVGTPKPAEGVQPPPLNAPIPEPGPPAPPPAPAPRVVEPRELAVRIPARPATAANPEVPTAASAPLPGGVPATAPDAAHLPIPEAPALPGPAVEAAPAPVAAPPAPVEPAAVPVAGAPA